MSSYIKGEELKFLSAKSRVISSAIPVGLVTRAFEQDSKNVMHRQKSPIESAVCTGGRIPGLPGTAAYRVWSASASCLPVMLAVPHAGRGYPRRLLDDMRNAESSCLKLEDRYVDRLARAVAQQTGAALLIAQAPRAMIDLNRAPDDVDWEMFTRTDRPDTVTSGAGRRARTGLGLIPRRLPGLGELWRRPLDGKDLTERVTQIHEPYHTCLGEMMRAHAERWGAALLLDLHSMPSLPARGGHPGAQFVVGDRFGASSAGSLVASAFAHFARTGRGAAHNRPYAGGYVLERHAKPSAGLHAMQIEIDRATYLDAALVETGDGFIDVVDVLCGLVRTLSQAVAELAEAGSSGVWPLAAE